MTDVRKQPTHRSTDPNNGHLRERSWYFEKRISMDTIVGLLGIAVLLGGPFIVWGRAMEAAQMQTQGRIQTLETQTEMRSKADAERDIQARERQREMANKVEKISDQMTALQVAVQLLAKPR